MNRPSVVDLVIPGPQLHSIGYNLDPNTTDAKLVELWLHGKKPHTQRAYRFEAERFLAFVARPLRTVSLADVQAWERTVTGAPASVSRSLAAIKSLIAFGHTIGYLPFDVGRLVKLPPRKDTLAERILSEAQVHAMIALEPNTRNRRMLRLLYVAGVRLDELVQLRWRDCQPRDGDSGQITVFGKGGKTRVVLLPPVIWASLEEGRRRANAPDAPVFPSHRGGTLHPTTVERIVATAARRAGIEGKVSPHWLRHAHATHALERGAPIHLVQTTLGHASVATTGRYLHARPTDSSARYLAV